MSAVEALRGARVRRIDAPWDDLLAITVTGEHVRGVLVAGLDPRARGIGLCETRPRGKPATGFVQALRRRLEGARLRSLHDEGSIVQLELERGGATWRLELWLEGAEGNVVLYDTGGAVTHSLRRARSRPEPGAARHGLDAPAEELRARGERLIRDREGATLMIARTALGRATRARAKHLRRRRLAIEGDLARADQVEDLRSRAGLLLSHLHALDPDARSATLLDPSRDPPVEIELQFEAGLGPRTQADAWFRRARRRERGATVARERLALTDRELAAVESLLGRVAAAPNEDALAALAPELERAGVALPRPGETRRERSAPERMPYREYTGSGERAILVGRGPADNDQLTLRHARPHDLWLHARGHAGAHVVVPLTRGEACPPDLLCDAATLAAHFSKAKGQQYVDVIYTPRRYVRKPRKAAPGLVTLQREKVFRLELEEARLKRLLSRERAVR